MNFNLLVKFHIQVIYGIGTIGNIQKLKLLFIKKETPTFWVGVYPKILSLEWLVEMPVMKPGLPQLKTTNRSQA
jgi:hypothetical protein